jgi:hypothetical protein
MEMFKGMTTKLLDDPRAGANQKEMANGDSEAISNRQAQDGKTNRGDAGARILEGWPDRTQPWRRFLLPKHVIDEPLNGPGLKQIDKNRKRQDQRADHSLARCGTPV